MVMLDVDLSQVPSIKPIPDGTYIVRLITHEKKPTQSGKEKLVWRTEILKPDDVAKDVKEFYFDTPLAEKALFRLKQLAEAALGSAPGSGFDTVALNGKEVGLVVTLESTPEWGERNRVQQFLTAKNTKPGLKPKTAQASDSTPAAAGAGGMADALKSLTSK